ncbi:MAG: hypothetical protein HQ572_04160 [Candidatus Omnitrophica bacterium]|nr:hypothetical protein [Candidatus Omnitrophota bacterium]
MGKILSIIIGTACVVVGVVFIFVFNEAFLLGLQFLATLILILGGLIAVIAGISEIKDSLTAKKSEETKNEEKKE